MKVPRNNCLSPSSHSFSNPAYLWHYKDTWCSGSFNIPVSFNNCELKICSSALPWLLTLACFLFWPLQQDWSMLQERPAPNTGRTWPWASSSSSGWACHPSDLTGKQEQWALERAFPWKRIQKNGNAEICCFLFWRDPSRVREWTQGESFQMTSTEARRPPPQGCWLRCWHIRKPLQDQVAQRQQPGQLGAPGIPCASHARGSHSRPGLCWQAGTIAEAAFRGPEPTAATSIPILRSVQHS